MYKTSFKWHLLITPTSLYLLVCSSVSRFSTFDWFCWMAQSILLSSVLTQHAWTDKTTFTNTPPTPTPTSTTLLHSLQCHLWQTDLNSLFSFIWSVLFERGRVVSETGYIKANHPTKTAESTYLVNYVFSQLNFIWTSIIQKLPQTLTFTPIHHHPRTHNRTRFCKIIKQQNIPSNCFKQSF